MIKIVLIILLLISGLYFPSLSFSETIVLKSGKTVEGKLVEKTGKYIKLEIHGVVVPYFKNEIADVGEKAKKQDDKVSKECLVKVKSDKETLDEAAGYHLQKRYDEEIDALNKAIKINPRFAEAYYNRAIAYSCLNKFAEAREDAYIAELEGEKVSRSFIIEINEEFNKDKNYFDDSKDMEISFEKEGLGIKDFNVVAQHYYENPQPDKLILVVKALLSLDWFISDVSGFNPFAHLVATVAYNNQNFLNDLKRLDVSFTGKQKVALEKIIYEAEHYRSREPNSPQGLDYLWSEFFATGSDEPVKKIIGILDDEKLELSDSQLIRPMAVWSLKANAKQDKRVYQIIKKQLASASGKLRERLKEVLK
ncbi:MAG: tetratricopeptide repeat protein [Candidatus Omnitrophica bacterium]|nr:tetratricopeptide repeat protein [Candidatus Omnitrophota bacterium]